MKINLLNNKGREWCHIENSFIKGYAFINDVMHDEMAIYNKFIDSINSFSVDEFLLSLNGSFSCVICYKEVTYLISDKIRGYPLLYIKDNNKWIVTDQSRAVLDGVNNYNFCEEALMEYSALGYLHGDWTWIEDCKQVMAGTYVKIEKETATLFEYHNYILDKEYDNDEHIMNQAEIEMDDAFKRMLLSLNGRPIFIPLSGGYDSRLLACLCKKFNVKNVSCYTYGLKDSWEIKISEKVASKFGFPWYCVEYSSEKWEKTFESEAFKDYMWFANNLNTLAHFQDFVAFSELKTKGIIPDDAIIIPGHSGEILGGDQVPYEQLSSNKSVADLLYNVYYRGNVLKNKYKKIVLNNFGRRHNEILSNDELDNACDEFNNWNIQNRQSNFIVNAVRVYEYFNNGWRVPLWDSRLSDFWMKVSWKNKYYQKLYNKFMFDKYFIPMDVEFYQNTSKSLTSNRSFVSMVQLPFGIKAKIKYLLSFSDYISKKYLPNNGNFAIKFFNKKISHIDYFISSKKMELNALGVLNQIYLLRNYNNKKQ